MVFVVDESSLVVFSGIAGVVKIETKVDAAFDNEEDDDGGAIAEIEVAGDRDEGDDVDNR